MAGTERRLLRAGRAGLRGRLLVKARQERLISDLDQGRTEMKAICGAAALALLLLAGAATAQTTYPDKQVRVLVGFAAGGPADIAARIVANYAGPRLSLVGVRQYSAHSIGPRTGSL